MLWEIAGVAEERRVSSTMRFLLFAKGTDQYLRRRSSHSLHYIINFMLHVGSQNNSAQGEWWFAVSKG